MGFATAAYSILNRLAMHLPFVSTTFLLTAFHSGAFLCFASDGKT
jgi:hypothetical protein